MTAADMEEIKDLPGYKVILKAVLKSQIQQLIEQLASATNEESIILTASVADGTLSHLGSGSAKGFLEDHEDVKSQFLSYCLKIHHRKSLEPEPERETDKPQQAYIALQETISPNVRSAYGKNLGRGKNQGKDQAVIGTRYQPYPRPGKKSGTTSSNQSVLSSNKATPSGDILSVKQEPLDDLNKATPSGDLGSVKLEPLDDSVDESGSESVTSRSVGTESDETADDGENDTDTGTYLKLEVDHASQDGGTHVSMGMNFDPTGATGSRADMTGKQGDTLEMEDKGRHPYSKWIPADYSSANAANEQLGSVELFICEVFGDVLPPERTMFNHMKRHMVDGQYQCECCNYRTPQVYRLRGHAARVHPQPVGIFGGYTIKYRPKPHFC